MTVRLGRSHFKLCFNIADRLLEEPVLPRVEALRVQRGERHARYFSCVAQWTLDNGRRSQRHQRCGQDQLFLSRRHQPRAASG